MMVNHQLCVLTVFALVLISATEAQVIEPVPLCTSAAQTLTANSTGIIRFSGITGSSIDCNLFLTHDILEYFEFVFTGTVNPNECSAAICPFPGKQLNLEISGSKDFCPSIGASYTPPVTSQNRVSISFYGNNTPPYPPFDLLYTIRKSACGTEVNIQNIPDMEGEFFTNYSLYGPRECSTQRWLLRSIPPGAAVQFTTVLWSSNTSDTPGLVVKIAGNIITHRNQSNGLIISPKIDGSISVSFDNQTESSINWAVVFRYKVLVCGEPPRIANAKFSRTQLPAVNGTRLSYSCKSGFSLRSPGLRMITCQLVGGVTYWSSTAGIACNPERRCSSSTLPTVANATVYNTNYLSALYDCADGFSRAPGSSAIEIQCSSPDPETTAFEWEPVLGIIVCMPDAEERTTSPPQHTVTESSTSTTTEATASASAVIALSVIFGILVIVVIGLMIIIIRQRRQLLEKYLSNGKTRKSPKTIKMSFNNLLGKVKRKEKKAEYVDHSTVNPSYEEEEEAPFKQYHGGKMDPIDKAERGRHDDAIEVGRQRNDNTERSRRDDKIGRSRRNDNTGKGRRHDDNTRRGQHDSADAEDDGAEDGERENIYENHKKIHIVQRKEKEESEYTMTRASLEHPYGSVQNNKSKFSSPTVYDVVCVEPSNTSTVSNQRSRALQPPGKKSLALQSPSQKPEIARMPGAYKYA